MHLIFHSPVSPQIHFKRCRSTHSSKGVSALGFCLLKAFRQLFIVVQLFCCHNTGKIKLDSASDK